MSDIYIQHTVTYNVLSGVCLTRKSLRAGLKFFTAAAAGSRVKFLSGQLYANISTDLFWEVGLVWTCANSVCLSQMFGAPNIRRIKILTQEGVLIKKWSSFCQPLISWWYGKGQTITIPYIVRKGGEGDPMAANDFLRLPSKVEKQSLQLYWPTSMWWDTLFDYH